ncbi:MAG: hypothetical protein ACTHLX_03480, partial [Candidatus Binatia bacterium]
MSRGIKGNGDARLHAVCIIADNTYSSSNGPERNLLSPRVGLRMKNPLDTGLWLMITAGLLYPSLVTFAQTPSPTPQTAAQTG